MNALIAAILKDRISQFTFVDKLAGMVRRVEYEREGGVVRIPVGTSVDDDFACDDSEQRAIIPDQSYACIVYFEDQGVPSTRSRTRGISYQSRLRLVCWVNTAKFGGDVLAADRIAQEFGTVMKTGPYNSGPFIGLRHQVAGMPERGHGIFSQYTYPNSARQYLLPPYDAFAIDITTDFRIKAGCEDQVTVADDACWTPPTTRRRRNPSEFTCEELLDPDTGLTQAQLIDCLNCTGTAMPGIIHYADLATAQADNTTVPTDQQIVVLDDTKNTYFGDGASTVAAIVGTKQYVLGVEHVDEGGPAEGLDTVMGTTPFHLQLNS